MNITREPEGWFDQVVACGLDGVRAGSIEGEVREAEVAREARRFAEILGNRLERKLRPLDESHPEIWDIVKDLDQAAVAAGPWPTKPTHTK